MNYNLLIVNKTTGEKTGQNSSELDLSVNSILIGSDLQITQGGGVGPAGYFDFGNRKLKSAFTPEDADDLVTKEYADSIAAGFDPKASVDVATAAALDACTAAGAGPGKTLTADANGALVIDGVTVDDGYRVLVKNQASAVDNGIYVVTDKGSAGTPWVLTRATDFDGAPTAEITKGAYTLVVEGTTHAGQNWYLVTGGAIVVDTTALNFSQASAAAAPLEAGDGLNISGNEINLVLEDTNPSLQIAAGKLGVKLGQGLENSATGVQVKLDGTSLARGANGIKVADSGITQAHIASTALGDGLKGGDGVVVAVDYAIAKTNQEAAPVAALKVVKISNTGGVLLADKSTLAFSDELGITEAEIAASASGKVIFRRGAIVPGFVGLEPGKIYYVGAAGAVAKYEDLTFAAGEKVFSIGKAVSTTQIAYNPQYEFTY